MRLVIRAIVYKCVVAMSRMCHPSYLVKYSLSSSTPLPLDFHLVVVIVVIVKGKVYCPLTQQLHTCHARKTCSSDKSRLRATMLLPATRGFTLNRDETREIIRF